MDKPVCPRFRQMVRKIQDCRLQNSRVFFLKSVKKGKVWLKSLTRAKRASLTRPSLPSLPHCLQPRSSIPDLLFDCSRVLEIRTGKFRPGIAFTICTSQFRPQRRKTGIKDGFEEMEHEFLFGIFRPEKQNYLFRGSAAPGNFPLERPKTSCSIYFPTEFYGIFLQ